VKARVNDSLEMCCWNGFNRRKLTAFQFMDLLYLVCKLQPKWFLDSEYQMAGSIIKKKDISYRKVYDENDVVEGNVDHWIYKSLPGINCSCEP
jgi:hypothetical protein